MNTTLAPLLIWLHVTGNLVWIGGILAVALILTSAAEGAGAQGASPPQSLRASTVDPRIRGELAVRVYSRIAVPAFLLSFACGMTQLVLNTSYYLVEHHWMHGKLVAALAVIALHHVIGARAKRMAAGAVQDSGPTAMIAGILALMAAAAAFFAIFRLPR